MAIRAMIVKPGQRPSVSYIDNDLQTLQALVDGPIETLTYAGCCMIVNEEGKLRADLEPNCLRFTPSEDGPLYVDTLFGVIVIVGSRYNCHTGEMEFIELSYEQVNAWRKIISAPSERSALWWFDPRALEARP